jgi:hypothetical protein
MICNTMKSSEFRGIRFWEISLFFSYYGLLPANISRISAGEIVLTGKM